jgi:hypothetical protein
MKYPCWGVPEREKIEKYPCISCSFLEMGEHLLSANYGLLEICGRRVLGIDPRASHMLILLLLSYTPSLWLCSSSPWPFFPYLKYWDDNIALEDNYKKWNMYWIQQNYGICFYYCQSKSTLPLCNFWGLKGLFHWIHAHKTLYLLLYFTKKILVSWTFTRGIE